MKQLAVLLTIAFSAQAVAGPPLVPLGPGNDPRLPEFVVVKAVSQRFPAGDLFADIINHCNNPILKYDRDTNAHESTHFINADLRNLATSQGRRQAGLYVGNNLAVMVDEPPFTKSQIATYVPANLRGQKFNDYLSAKSFHDRPLHILDEWVAYTNGSMVSIQDHETGVAITETGVGFNPIEMMVYAGAIVLAAEELSPRYSRNEQLRRFLSWHGRRAVEVFKIGRRLPPYAGQGSYLAEIHSENGKNIRRIWADLGVELPRR